jgi:hypothetical protein
MSKCDYVIYIHMYTHAHVHACISVFMYVRMYVCMYVCMHKCIHVWSSENLNLLTSLFSISEYKILAFFELSTKINHDFLVTALSNLKYFISLSEFYLVLHNFNLKK